MQYSLQRGRRFGPAPDWTFVNEVAPIPRCPDKDVVGPPIFPGNPNCALAMLFDPAGPRRLAFTALWYCARTLRAAITDDYARLASGGGQPFPGGIPVYPLSSYRQFRPFGFLYL